MNRRVRRTAVQHSGQWLWPFPLPLPLPLPLPFPAPFACPWPGLLGVGVGVGVEFGAADAGFVVVVATGAGLVTDPPPERVPVVVPEVAVPDLGTDGTELCGTGAYAGADDGVVAAWAGFGDVVASGTATWPEEGTRLTCTGRFS